MNENKYYIPDIETGFKVEVSCETWEAYIKMYDDLKPKFDPEKYKSIPLVFGTAGDMGAAEDFENIFYKPDTYKLDGK